MHCAWHAWASLVCSSNLKQLQVVVVSDETASISAEVRAASDAHEIVITAGGVGPTLDDVTLAGIAKALGKPLMRYCTPIVTASDTIILARCKIDALTCFRVPHIGLHVSFDCQHECLVSDS